MTFKQTLLKHWWKIIIGAILAPLVISFGYYGPEDTPIGGFPVKYIAALVAGLGAYTTIVVKDALTSIRKPTSVAQKSVIPKQESIKEDDLFSQFGEA